MTVSFEPRLDFIMDGVSYIHADPTPEHSSDVRRFPYREEPKVIVQVPLQDGETVEVHGFATQTARSGSASRGPTTGTCTLSAGESRRRPPAN